MDEKEREKEGYEFVSFSKSWIITTISLLFIAIMTLGLIKGYISCVLITSLALLDSNKKYLKIKSLPLKKVLSINFSIFIEKTLIKCFFGLLFFLIVLI